MWEMSNQSSENTSVRSRALQTGNYARAERHPHGNDRDGATENARSTAKSYKTIQCLQKTCDYMFYNNLNN